MTAGADGARLCAVTVDLDTLDCYHRIHGLPPPRLARDPVLAEAVPRFVDLLAPRSAPATFFVIGEAARSPAARGLLTALVRAGHEVANHSDTHPYDLFRQPEAAITSELRRAHDAIAAAAGQAPVGFRAPGYGVSPRLLRAVADLGYRYDSSLLPSPPYYGAKAAIMGLMRLGGRPSRSALADPRLMLAPLAPYRPDLDAPWRRGDAPFLELPITVLPGTRVPLVGGTLTGAPASLRRVLLLCLARVDVVVINLHGIELLDAAGDDLPAALRTRQPDLALPLAHKRAAFGRTLDAVARGGYRFVTLAAMADALAARAAGG